MRMCPSGVDDQERAERARADVVDVADHLVRRKLRGLVGVRAHVALEELPLRQGMTADGRLRRWRLLFGRSLSRGRCPVPKTHRNRTATTESRFRRAKRAFIEDLRSYSPCEPLT